MEATMSRTTETLLRKALFNELSPGERGELDALLRSSPETRQRLERLQGAAALLGPGPEIAPPADLEQRVLARLPDTPPQVADALNLTRCAFYFFLAGVLQILLGAGMLEAFSDPALSSDLLGWAGRQPAIALATGVFFLAAGVLLLVRRGRAARPIYTALLCYIVFVAGNGVALRLSMSAPSLDMGVMAFVGAGLSVGLFLGAMLRKYSPEVHHGK
jgi:hypothetical protein